MSSSVAVRIKGVTPSEVAGPGGSGGRVIVPPIPPGPSTSLGMTLHSLLQGIRQLRHFGLDRAAAELRPDLVDPPEEQLVEQVLHDRGMIARPRGIEVV